MNDIEQIVNSVTRILQMTHLYAILNVIKNIIKIIIGILLILSLLEVIFVISMTLMSKSDLDSVKQKISRFVRPDTTINRTELNIDQVHVRPDFFASSLYYDDNSVAHDESNHSQHQTLIVNDTMYHLRKHIHDINESINQGETNETHDQ